MARLHGRSLASLLLVALIVSSVVGTGPAWSSATSDQLLQEISSTYSRVSSIEGEGGNVTAMVAQLNQAISFVNLGISLEGTDAGAAQSAYQQARSILQLVDLEMPGVESAGIAASQSAVFWLVVTLVSLGAAGVLALLFGRRAFWAVWIRLHQDWVVSKK